MRFDAEIKDVMKRYTYAEQEAVFLFGEKSEVHLAFKNIHSGFQKSIGMMSLLNAYGPPSVWKQYMSEDVYERKWNEAFNEIPDEKIPAYIESLRKAMLPLMDFSEGHKRGSLMFRHRKGTKIAEL